MINRRSVIQIVCAVLVANAAVAGVYQKTLVNSDSQGVILHGYDPVAYFTENKAVKGDEKYKATYKGSVFHFASNKNKKLFEKDPVKYIPQYGGYCAMAVAMGQLEDADPNMFVVHDGKLLVQRNEKAHQMFMTNPGGFHQKADEQWPKLVEKNGK